MRLAAIDIGSNAARLLIVEVKNKRKPEYKKLQLIRIPLRLGFDVFTQGRISRDKARMMLDMMRAFRALLDVYQVDKVKAYATSAMRNAANNKSIIKAIKKKTAIQIEIISGSVEAHLLYESHAAEKIDKNRNYLYVNVGGGSTEISLFTQGKAVQEFSYEIGTIRILKNAVKQGEWDDLKNKLKSLIKDHTITAIIGTGGNINKIFSLSKTKEGKALTYRLIKSYYRKLSKLTTADRIKQFKLSEDRADVLVPALDIYLSIMQWSKVTDMYVPKIGLVDGIIGALYHDINSSNHHIQQYAMNKSQTHPR